jgi:UDP-N-acetylmuramyl pentapeptide phosphotransferase/UDP-N-acetylglucosamine-1-phosphate transferase
MKIAGLVLIVIGALALIYQVFTYTTTEKDVQLGPIQIQHQEQHNIPIPPIVGGICIVAGVVALAAGGRSNL